MVIRYSKLIFKFNQWFLSIGNVHEYPTMHYLGIPRHTPSMIAYKILTEYFWKIHVKTCIGGMLFTYAIEGVILPFYTFWYLSDVIPNIVKCSFAIAITKAMKIPLSRFNDKVITEYNKLGCYDANSRSQFYWTFWYWHKKCILNVVYLPDCVNWATITGPLVMICITSFSLVLIVRNSPTSLRVKVVLLSVLDLYTVIFVLFSAATRNNNNYNNKVYFLNA